MITLEVSPFVLILILVGVVGLGAYLLGRGQRPNPDAQAANNAARRDLLSFDTRTGIAVGIVIISMIVIAVVGAIYIASSTDELRPQAANSFFTSVLPLFGTWVGTVLAYYFSKDNFESASKSLSTLQSAVNRDQQRASEPIGKYMLTEFHSSVYNANAALAQLLSALTIAAAGKPWNRIPLLDNNRRPRLMLHKSTITEFLDRKVSDPAPAKTRDQWTVQDLLDDTSFKATYPRAESTFGTLPQSSTIAQAKATMDNIRPAQDIFVTEDGTQNARVVGWVTNVDLEEQSKVE